MESESAVRYSGPWRDSLTLVAFAAYAVVGAWLVTGNWQVTTRCMNVMLVTTAASRFALGRMTPTSPRR